MEISKYREVTEEGKKVIVDKHNELRRRVAMGQEKNQPPASNMREIIWNDELATIAQRWTDQCNFGHDKNRNKLDGTYVGQNAYTGGGSEQTLEEVSIITVLESSQALIILCMYAFISINN